MKKRKGEFFGNFQEQTQKKTTSVQNEGEEKDGEAEKGRASREPGPRDAQELMGLFLSLAEQLIRCFLDRQM